MKTQRLHSAITKKKRLPKVRGQTFNPHSFEHYCFTDTGLPHHYVWSIYQKTERQIKKPRSPHAKRQTMCSVSPFTRLYIILCLIRKGETAAGDLAIRFDVSPSFISRDRRHIIPILYTSIGIIRFFKPDIFGWLVHSWRDYLIAGAIDGTCHFRERVHPGQANWYRGDKHRHFALAQVS